MSRPQTSIDPRAVYSAAYHKRPGQAEWKKKYNATHYEARGKAVALAKRLTPRERAASLLGGARGRKRAVTITREWIEQRVKVGLCEATGIPFDLKPTDTYMNPLAPSLDRIDSSKDYTPENTRVVLHAFNMAKGQMEESYAKKIIIAMAAGLARM